jgi:hydrogenase maturation protease
VARILVIGIGNVLEGDDAFGPTVIHLFEAAWTVPEDVEVVDGGTPGLDLTAYMAERDAMIIVDSMSLKGGAPGELRVLDKAGILNRGPIIAMSPHDPGLRESILHAEFQGVSPKILKLIGVVAGDAGFGCFLTPAVRSALPVAVAQVKAELTALGVPVTPRVPAGDPNLWWEKPQHG